MRVCRKFSRQKIRVYSFPKIRKWSSVNCKACVIYTLYSSFTSSVVLLSRMINYSRINAVFDHLRLEHETMFTFSLEDPLRKSEKYINIKNVKSNYYFGRFMAPWSSSFFLVCIFFCWVLVTELVFLRKMLENSTNFSSLFTFFFFWIFYVSRFSRVCMFFFLCHIRVEDNVSFVLFYLRIILKIHFSTPTSYMYTQFSADIRQLYFSPLYTCMCGNYHHKRFLSVRVVWIRLNILGFKVQLLRECAWIWFLSWIFSVFLNWWW